jgi:hypothetical protein
VGLLRSKLKELLDLEQGNHSVFDYMRQFNTLAQYGTYHVDTDEKKANSSSNSHCSSNSSSNSTVPLLHHRSRLPSGHHSSFPPATFHASTAGRWTTLIKNATCLSKATRRELRHLWSISRGAIRRVLHHRWATPTTPPWRRFPLEKKC